MSKPTDWSIEERKLQPVYDDVLAGRIKPARETIDRWLKKHPKSQPALVMQMVILEKTGASLDMVLAAYETIKKTAPLSGRSVWWIGMTLRNIGRPDLVLTLYQELWDARPEVVELGEQVFLHAAAINDIETMMSSSRKVFNSVKSPEWARLAAFSQLIKHTPLPTNANPFPLSPAKALLPATLLLRASGPIPPSSSILWLALHIALSSGDVNEAAKLIREHGVRGSLERAWVVMEATKSLSEMGGIEGWDEECFERALEVVEFDEEAQRNYAFYRHLIHFLSRVSTPTNQDKVKSTLTTLLDKIGDKERAPALALMVLGSAGDGDGTMLKKYWDRWGSKGSIISELEGLVLFEKVVERGVVESILKETIMAGHSDLKSYLTLVNAEIYLLRQTKPIPSIATAKKFWNLYLSGLEYGVNLPKTDVQYADEVGLVAIQLLVAIWHQAQNEQALVQAVSCAEYILTKSPSPHARFFLISLYRLLGAPQLASAHLEMMKLSEIMLDTLSFSSLERGAVEAYLSSTSAKVWGKTVEAAEKMYKRSASDLPEYIKQALENESYSKVYEIRALIDALDMSLSARVLQIESIWSSTLNGTEYSTQLVNALHTSLQKELIDNRNYELLPDSTGLGMKLIVDRLPIGSGWVKVMGWMVIRLAKWTAGEEFTDDCPSFDHVSESEIAMVHALKAVLQAASPNESSVNKEENCQEIMLGSLFDRNIELCLSADKASLHPIFVLVQLCRALQVILKRVNQLLQVPKGKKRDPVLVKVQLDLKTALNVVKEKKDQLEVWLERDPVKVVPDFFEDKIVEKTIKKIEQSRKELKEAILKALTK